jgi:Na+-driven multidrug efflux pump
VIPRAFTSDPDVIDQAHDLWPLFCALWPAAAVVFALDGILIGAGDTAYLAAAMIVAFVVFLPLVLTADTVAGVWAALDVLMLARLATLGRRFLRRRWALVGAHA